MPELSWVGLVVVAFCAVMVGVAKTGIPGFGILVVPLMAMVLPAAELGRDFTWHFDTGGFVCCGLLQASCPVGACVSSSSCGICGYCSGLFCIGCGQR